YSLGDKRSYLWVVSKDSITAYELPPRKRVEEAALHFYELTSVGDQSGGAADAARTLAEMVLSPAAGLLGSKRLIIIADGALNYVPFAALPSQSSAGPGSAPGESGGRGSGR